MAENQAINSSESDADSSEDDHSNIDIEDLPVIPASISEVLKELGKINHTKIPSMLRYIAQKKVLKIKQPFRQIINYQIPSLINGRPLNTSLIVMMGDSGSGKSSTINRLFEDSDLCKTSDSETTTRTVKECTKRLRVQSKTFPLQANLTFIDVPGTHGDDRSKDSIDLAVIKQFRNEYNILKKRQCPANPFAMIGQIKIREEVYPNLILLVVEATDPRMTGPDSKFRQCLKILKGTNLIDFQRVNLIVVATKAMSLALVKSKYIQKTTDIKKRIVDIASEILNIEDVKVVFIENEPEDFVEKEEGCDFYRLPNDELSHHNLFCAMRDLFVNNNDTFGYLLTSWYFGSDRPEKREKATIQDVKYDNDSNDRTLENYIKQAEIILQQVMQKDNTTSTNLQLTVYARNEEFKNFSNKRDETSDKGTEEASKPNNQSCFPLYSRVLTRCGWIKLSEIHKESQLITLEKKQDDASKFEHVQNKFCTFLHFDLESFTEYLILSFDNGKELTISPDHLMFLIISGSGGLKPVRSREVSLGDSVLFTDTDCDDLTEVSSQCTTWVKVVCIEEKYIQGMCAPLTETGTLIVDGVFVSCYSNIDSHLVAHWCLAPLRIWIRCQQLTLRLIDNLKDKRYISSVNDEFPKNDLVFTSCRKNKGSTRIHAYAKVLMFIRSYISLKILKE